MRTIVQAALLYKNSAHFLTSQIWKFSRALIQVFLWTVFIFFLFLGPDIQNTLASNV